MNTHSKPFPAVQSVCVQLARKTGEALYETSLASCFSGRGLLLFIAPSERTITTTISCREAPAPTYKDALQEQRSILPKDSHLRQACLDIGETPCLIKDKATWPVGGLAQLR